MWLNMSLSLTYLCLVFIFVDFIHSFIYLFAQQVTYAQHLVTAHCKKKAGQQGNLLLLLAMIEKQK